ncbi:MAG: hypothetical protein ACI9BF_000810 [Candidatus Paceibacteria bacterium]|jgi:hypothetical protein
MNHRTLSHLDPSQKSALNAISNASEDESLFLVYGPPGTGKSQLVVSLLNELAVKGKRVLFLSQNIEALEVVNRMIIKSEKEMGFPVDGQHLSLKDFCLHLYKAEHRYKKHILGQLSRLNTKPLPSTYESDIQDTYAYPLKYTELDHNENYGLKNGDLGFDELLNSRLKYVDQKMLTEPLYNFNEIDVRKVFDLLLVYENESMFNEFAQPKNELRFITKIKQDIQLPLIREEIVQILKHKDIVKKTNFPIKHKISIVEYFNLVSHLDNMMNFFDIRHIITDGKDIEEIERSVQQIHMLKTDLVKQDDLIDGLANNITLINVNEVILNRLDDNSEDVEKVLKVLLEVSNKLLKAVPNIIHGSIADLAIYYAKDILHDIENFYKEYEAVVDLDAEQINELHDDFNDYNAKGKLKKLIKRVPASFKKYFKTDDKQIIDWWTDYEDEMSVIHTSLSSTSLTIKDLIKLSKRKSQGNIRAINPDKGKSSQNKAEVISEYIFLASKLKNDLGYNGNKEYSSIVNWLQEKQEYVVLFNKIKLTNMTLALKTNADGLIGSINRTTLHHKSKAKIEELLKEMEPFLDNLLSKSSDITSKTEEILKTISYSKDYVPKIDKYLKLPLVIDRLDNASAVDKFVKLLSTTEKEKHFRDDFFSIETNSDLITWFNSIESLSYFDNIEMYNSFLKHNSFINSIESAVGVRNKPWIQKLLENDDVNYQSFCQRLSNTIINVSFEMNPESFQKHVKSDYFKKFSENLTTDKLHAYTTGLKYIRHQTKEPARFLSNSNNWEAGRSPIDRLRKNTLSISKVYPIIIATPKEISKYVSSKKELFDYVIFDEASQLLPGQALPSIYRSKRAVIIGDPHQMPPVLNASVTAVNFNADDLEDEETGESILDLARKQTEEQHHLRVHYRSESSKLFEPSRNAIYKEDGIEPIQEAALSGKAAIDIEDDLGEGLDENGYDKNFMKICESLTKWSNEEPDSDYCVLFARKDVSDSFVEYLVTGSIDKHIKLNKLYNDSKILISTVTNCQGIEGDYTLLYLQTYQSPGSMWFFSERAGAYKRLNVSITRQRKGLKLLLANPKSQWLDVCTRKIENNGTGPNTQKSAELLKSLLQNAGELMDTSYLDRLLASNVIKFDSPLTEQLYDKLTDHYENEIGVSLKFYCEVGWHLLIPDKESVENNKRNIGFRVDIGVYSTEMKKFILGIEMDGAAYHSGFDKEHSDFTRQKVLEKKGWEIYRIWSSNWLNSTEEQFNKLTNRIDKILEKDT